MASPSRRRIEPGHGRCDPGGRTGFLARGTAASAHGRRSRSTAPRSPTRSSATGPPWVLTPGGRFSKDTPGVRELADALGRARAAGADLGSAEHRRVRRVLHRRVGVGDAGRHAGRAAASARPGAGGRSSVAPVAHGSRCSPRRGTRGRARLADGVDLGWRLRVAARSPRTTAASRSAPRGRAAWRPWSSCPSGPRCSNATRATAQRFLALDPREFIATLERWMLVYCPRPERGRCRGSRRRVRDARRADARLPQRRERSAPHARDVGAAARACIPGSRLVEPPWRDDEWNERGDGRARRAPARCSNAGRCSHRSCSSSPPPPERRPLQHRRLRRDGARSSERHSSSTSRTNRRSVSRASAMSNTPAAVFPAP